MQLIIIVAVCAIVAGASFIILGPDKMPEEVAEEVLKDETGINVDLTPESKENK